MPRYLHELLRCPSGKQQIHLNHFRKLATGQFIFSGD